MIRRLVVLALLVGGAALLVPLRAPTEGVIAPTSLFLFGILLLTADTLGALAHDLGLPRIAGYLLAGLVLGPSVAGLVPRDVLGDLGMMKQLAVGLIGLMAGVELRIADLRQRWRTVLTILAAQTVLVILAVMVAVFVGQRWLPFAAGIPFAALMAFAVIIAVTLTVNSPMVTLALLSETRAEGPVAKTVLEVVLLADVLIILLFTVTLGLVQGPLGEGVTGGGLFVRLWQDLVGSLLAGAVIGGILTLYVRFVRAEMMLFSVVLVFGTAAAANALHFELLLSLLVAGFLVENVAPVRAEPLVDALHTVAAPIFVVFFALAGGELRLDAFLALWPVVFLVAGARAAGVWAGATWGARHSGAPEAVQRYAWTGLVSQAGVALGLATLIAERFPRSGASVQAVIVGVIALNETLGPVLFRRGLERAGEVREEG